MFLQIINDGLSLYRCPLSLDFELNPVRISKHPNPEIRMQAYGFEAAQEILENGVCPLSRVPLDNYNNGPLVGILDEMVLFMLGASESLDMQSHKSSLARYQEYKQEVDGFLLNFLENVGTEEEPVYVESEYLQRMRQVFEQVKNFIEILGFLGADGQMNPLSALKYAYQVLERPVRRLHHHEAQVQHFRELLRQNNQDLARQDDLFEDGAGLLLFVMPGQQNERQRRFAEFQVRGDGYEDQIDFHESQIQNLNVQIAGFELGVQFAKDALNNMLNMNGVEIDADCLYQLVQFGLGDLSLVTELAQREQVLIANLETDTQRFRGALAFELRLFDERSAKVQEYSLPFRNRIANMERVGGEEGLDNLREIRRRVMNFEDVGRDLRVDVINYYIELRTRVRQDFEFIARQQEVLSNMIDEFVNRASQECEACEYEEHSIDELPVIDYVKELNKRLVKGVASCRQSKARIEGKYEKFLHDDFELRFKAWNDILLNLGADFSQARLEKNKPKRNALGASLKAHRLTMPLEPVPLP